MLSAYIRRDWGDRVNNERRKAWRTELTLDVWYESEGERISTRTSDLSIKGAYIETVTPLPVDSLINLIFTLPDGMVIESQGIVMHSHPRQGMGIRFTSLSSEQRNYIRQFIHA